MSAKDDTQKLALATLHLAQEVRAAMHWPEKFKAEKEIEMLIAKDEYIGLLAKLTAGTATDEGKKNNQAMA